MRKMKAAPLNPATAIKWPMKADATEEAQKAVRKINSATVNNKPIEAVVEKEALKAVR